MNTKKCFKCKKVKLLNGFYKHKHMGDGHLNKCKQCTKKDVLQHRENNLERIKAYDRFRDLLPKRVVARKIYATTEKGKRAGNKAKRKWNNQNPEKRAANILLGYAIARGQIKKQPCEKCSSILRIHGHHEDYTKPLDVNWLCPQCHSNLHKDLRLVEKMK